MVRNTISFKQRPYRVSPENKTDRQDRQVEKMLAKGIIYKFVSPCSPLVVFVKRRMDALDFAFIFKPTLSCG